MNLQVEFKKETNESAYDLVNLKYKEYYVEWLETKIEQLLLHGVLVNEANPNSKEHQAKLLREIMQGDEELELYSEVKFVCDKDDKKSICNNPLSHECCNKHHKRI